MYKIFNNHGKIDDEHVVNENVDIYWVKSTLLTA